MAVRLSAILPKPIPKKEVRAHPKIILAAGGKKKPDLLTNLRQAGIPADGLALLAQAAPRPLDRSGLGLDIEVCPTALIETLNTLWRENRLEMEAGLQEKALATIWSRLGPPFDPAELGPEKTTIMAVAAPLWFRENNRHRQSYQSSAKSVRRFT